MKYRLCILIAALMMLLQGTALAVTLPGELQAIEESAFEGDAALAGVAVLPDGVIFVGSRAFAETGLHALVLPVGCGGVEPDVLAGGQAAYVKLQDAETIITGEALVDVPFVFGPADGSASELPGFYAWETLVEASGFYFSVTEGASVPLCAVDGTKVSGTVTLPKFVDGQPVLSLDTLSLNGCGGLTGLSVPSYLEIPSGLTATAYDAMTVAVPTADLAESPAGEPVTWTTSVTGAYGDVAYLWTFDVDGVLYSDITAEPTVAFSSETVGQCTVTVKAVDALNDEVVSGASAAVTITEPKPVYRALLVGNIYSGDTQKYLEGCDTDVAAMRKMLSKMSGTDYSVTAYIDLTASGIKSAIASTFADARECDVSLFYYSGHGSNNGSLVGVGSTGNYVTVSDLRILLDEIPGKKIVIIDACYSGNMIGKSTDASGPAAFTSAFISGFSSFNKANLASNGYHVMTACSKDQRSQSLSDGRIAFGAFTFGICYGSGYDEWDQAFISGMPADTNGDGAITLGESYAMAVEQVEWLKAQVGFDQSAQYYGDTSFVLWSK